MSRAGLRRTTTFRFDNEGRADNVPLRLRGAAFGRPPTDARHEKAPAFREGFAYEIVFAAQVRLLAGSRVGQADGDGEQHHEFA